jgi:hypothetical protein
MPRAPTRQRTSEQQGYTPGTSSAHSCHVQPARTAGYSSPYNRSAGVPGRTHREWNLTLLIQQCPSSPHPSAPPKMKIQPNLFLGNGCRSTTKPTMSAKVAITNPPWRSLGGHPPSQGRRLCSPFCGCHHSRDKARESVSQSRLALISQSRAPNRDISAIRRIRIVSPRYVESRG